MIFKRALLLVLPIAATLQIACDKGGSNNASTSSSGTSSSSAAPSASAGIPAPSSLASAAPSAPARATSDRRAGLGGLFFRAARDLEIKEEQKATLDKLEAPLRVEEPDVKEEMKLQHTDMIAGLKAGKMDTAAMQKHYAVIDKAAQARHDKEAESLNGLHAALDATQRKALVAAVRAKHANDGKASTIKFNSGDGGVDEWSKRRLERMTKELTLDAAQQKTVATLLTKGGDRPTPAILEAHKAESKKRMDALLAAFEQDTFDAKKLELTDVVPKKAHEAMDHEIQFLSQLTPSLKPEQREKLAASMEHTPRGAKDRPHGGGDGEHGGGGGDHGGGDHGGARE